MKTSLLSALGLSLCAALLLSSCGGGGGGGSSVALAPVGGPISGTSQPSGADPAAGNGDGGSAGAGGIGGVAAGDSSSTTASNGDEGSGVGSGGTGVSTADATGVGSVDGAGSIIVNGLRYDTTAAIGNIQDAPDGLQLGMSVKVTGPVNPDFTRGVARRVESAGDLRGPVASINLPQGSFVMPGTTVTTDEATIWADASGLAAIAPGDTLQVWGLPAGPGMLRATRVERRNASSSIVTGTVAQLDAALNTFTLGTLVVDYSNAASRGGVDSAALTNGVLVRVRAGAIDSGRLVATNVELWYPLPRTEAATEQLAGIVTDYAGPGSLRVLGIPVDASAAHVTGGPAGAVGNGVKVVVGGVMTNGVLKATQFKIRNVPGTGGPANFELIGTIGAFTSPSGFRVKDQPVDASGPDVVFTNGSAANLGAGVKVNIRGSVVINGVLAAQSVTFQ